MMKEDSSSMDRSGGRTDLEEYSRSIREPSKYRHHPGFDYRLQKLFDQTVSKAEYGEIREFLLRYSENIDINAYDDEGQTPLQRFCMIGALPLVKLLVQYGANPALTNREGWSPLHIASFSGNSELLSYIVSCTSANSRNGLQ